MTSHTSVKTHPLMIFKFTRRYVFVLLIPLVRGLLNYGVTGAFSRLVIMEALLAFLILAVSVVRWLYFSVIFCEDCIVIDSGVVIRRHAVMPLDKVSVSYTERNPLLSFFGAVAARIDTDSGFRQKADFEIYFSKKAASMYEQLLQSDKKGEVRYHSRFGMAVIMALANASALTGLIILAPAVNRVGKVLGDRLNNGLRDTISFATALIGKIVPPAATIIAIVFVAGFVVSFLLTLIRYMPYRMRDCGDRLVIEHGLIARHRTAINRQSINAVIVNIPPVMRPLHYCWVGVSAAGYGKKRGESEVVLPAVNMREANGLDFGGLDMPTDDKYDLKCPLRTMRRAVFMPAVVLAVMVLSELTLMLVFSAFSGMIALVMSFAELTMLYFMSVRINYQRCGGVSLYDGVVMRSYKRLTIKKMRVKKDKTCMLVISQGPLERRFDVVRVAVTVRAERPMTLKAVNLDKKQTDDLINCYFGA